MVIGGLVRRITPSDLKGERETPFQAIQTSVERIESVLKEVDRFVNLPPPQKKLERVDRIVEGEIERCDSEWQKNGLRPLLSIKTSNVMIPIDADFFWGTPPLDYAFIPSGTNCDGAFSGRDRSEK